MANLESVLDNVSHSQQADHTSLIQTRSELSTAQSNISNLQTRMTTAEGNISSNAQNLTGEIGRAKSVEQDLMEGMAILINGDKSATGAAAGQYVYLKDSTITGAADGLYKAAQAIPANTVIDVTYLTAVSAGGLNSLNDSIKTLIKTATETITTNVAGAGATSLTGNHHMIACYISGYANSFYLVNNIWAVEVFYGTANGLTPSANATHTVTYYYIDD